MKLEEASNLESSLLHCPVCGKDVMVVKNTIVKCKFGTCVDALYNHADIDTEVSISDNIGDPTFIKIFCECGKEWKSAVKFVHQWKSKLGIKGDITVTIDGFKI